nr:MAG TPA: hypothetical protein [Caudoviricetes sp.]
MFPFHQFLLIHHLAKILQELDLLLFLGLFLDYKILYLLHILFLLKKHLVIESLN